jgi:hypothetical protein
VPDGTTAMVRCPACKTVFSPAAGLAPPEPEPEEEERKPKKVAKKREKEDEPQEKEPEEKPKRRRRPDPDDDESLSPAERAALRAAFARAAWGCKLIWGSLLCYLISMMLIIAFWFQTAFTDPSPVFITLAGVLGLFNWLLAAIGVGLCISGPRSPGHLGYGIAAAVATGMHLLLVAILVGQGQEYSVGKEADQVTGDRSNANWGLIPTRLDAVTFYIPLLIYQDEEILPKGKMTLSIIVGVAEMLRTMLILMLVSCLARAAGDDELAHQCTRGAGFASLGPAMMAVGMLLFTVAIIETNAQTGTFATILFTTVRMGTYAIINGTLFPGFMAARETADACDEPFQTRIPKL